MNLASRLEGLSKPGRILVCARTRARLSDGFAFESRGLVDIKGAGQQEVFFINRQAEASPQPAVAAQ